MNTKQDKILVIANPDSKTLISNCLEDIAGIELLEADSENKAFELIYNHFFVLVILDETMPQIDMYKIGSMLLSHKETYNPPLLIITDVINPGSVLTDFKDLQIDYILKPFDEQLILAKIKIFFELFKLKNAVDQSINELDKAYKKIIDQHESVMKEVFTRKDLINRSSIAANQMHQPLQSMQGNIYHLLRNKEITPEIKSNLVSIKTATERIVQISKKLLAFPGKAKKTLLENAADLNENQTYKILCFETSDTDFNIFNHFIKGIIRCKLTQAKTLEQGIEFIADSKFDLIFIDHLLPDGTGFDLLSKLTHMRSDIPVIFTLDKINTQKGPKAVAQGAFSYFIKEEISTRNILSIIQGTLEKARLTREVIDAQSRITMISRKDALTKLYNKRCFEQELIAETSKAKRYDTALSIMIVDFDKFSNIVDTHGNEAGDFVLTTGATIVQSMVRNNDVVCRYGNEEFGVVLSNTGINGARMLAERIRKKIAGHGFDKISIELELTVSIGIASYAPETDKSYSTLVKKALDALASATDQGGNKVRVHIN